MENPDNPGQINQVFLDRKDGRLALYINGDLQFNSEDERLYHEPLAWLPTSLAVRRNSVPGQSIRVLILGGGDGLALREVLRFPEVGEVHVVERDPEVLKLGQIELAEINRNSFEDGRVQIHEMDARDFKPAGVFEVIIFDLTYPKDVATSSLFSVSFMEFMKQHLHMDGILAMNAVSPTKTPKAFGCIARTLHTLQLYPLPYSCEIPSFTRLGYGRWGFFLASQRPVTTGELSSLPIPVDIQISTKEDAFQVPVLFMDYQLAAAVNQTQELLYYLGNDSPITWDGPFCSMTFGLFVTSPIPISIAQQFAHWVQTPKGRVSLQNLLSFMPQPARVHTRQSLLDWSAHAGAALSEATFLTFVNRLFDRSEKLPPEWAKEIDEIRKRSLQGTVSAALEAPTTYRIFAMFMILLLYANFLFKDNLFAKESGPFSDPYDHH